MGKRQIAERNIEKYGVPINCMSQQGMTIVSLVGVVVDMAGLSFITIDAGTRIYGMSWSVADGDNMKTSETGVSRTSVGFTTVLYGVNNAVNEEYVGEKVQANSNGAEVIFSTSTFKSTSTGSLRIKVWRGPTEGTSAGATLLVDYTGSAPSSGNLTTTVFHQAILAADEFLMLEWVSATGAPTGGCIPLAVVVRG